MLLEEGVGVSATKIKIWFWDILERQVNFGRGARDLGRGGVKAAPRKEKKYAAPFKKSPTKLILPRPKI